MRVWDIKPNMLCDKHLIAQHHEIHCIHSIITGNKTGFANHPEVKRWRGHIIALCKAHEYTAAEMLRRGFNHSSEVESYPIHLVKHPESWQSVTDQLNIIKSKGCKCPERWHNVD